MAFPVSFPFLTPIVDIFFQCAHCLSEVLEKGGGCSLSLWQKQHSSLRERRTAAEGGRRGLAKWSWSVPGLSFLICARGRRIFTQKVS